MQAIRQAHQVGGARVASAARPAAARPLTPLVPKSRGATIARAIELDFSDPDTQLSMAGLVLGLVFGIGAPVWYASRADRDEELLEEVRSLNRANYEATGEYLTEVSRVPTGQEPLVVSNWGAIGGARSARATLRHQQTPVADALFFVVARDEANERLTIAALLPPSPPHFPNPQPTKPKPKTGGDRRHPQAQVDGRPRVC